MKALQRIDGMPGLACNDDFNSPHSKRRGTKKSKQAAARCRNATRITIVIGVVAAAALTCA